MDITEKLKTNLRDRITAVPLLVTTPADNLITAVQKVIKLQPVKALTGLIRAAGDGTAQFIDTQADITRRWMGA